MLADHNAVGRTFLLAIRGAARPAAAVYPEAATVAEEDCGASPSGGSGGGSSSGSDLGSSSGALPTHRAAAAKSAVGTFAGSNPTKGAKRARRSGTRSAAAAAAANDDEGSEEVGSPSSPLGRLSLATEPAAEPTAELPPNNNLLAPNALLLRPPLPAPHLSAPHLREASPPALARLRGLEDSVGLCVAAFAGTLTRCQEAHARHAAGLLRRKQARDASSHLAMMRRWRAANGARRETEGRTEDPGCPEKRRREPDKGQSGSVEELD